MSSCTACNRDCWWIQRNTLNPSPSPRPVFLRIHRLNIYSYIFDANNHGGLPTSDAVAGLAYYFSGHDYLDVPGLDISPRAFPQLTVGAWVKVSGGHVWDKTCSKHKVEGIWVPRNAQQHRIADLVAQLLLPSTLSSLRARDSSLNHLLKTEVE